MLSLLLGWLQNAHLIFGVHKNRWFWNEILLFFSIVLVHDWSTVRWRLFWGIFTAYLIAASSTSFWKKETFLKNLVRQKILKQILIHTCNSLYLTRQSWFLLSTQAEIIFHSYQIDLVFIESSITDFRAFMKIAIFPRCPDLASH